MSSIHEVMSMIMEYENKFIRIAVERIKEIVIITIISQLKELKLEPKIPD